MSYIKTNFSRPLLKFLEILDNNSLKFRSEINKAIILLHYFQILSYLLKIYRFEGFQAFKAISIVIFYSNIANILAFLSNPTLSLAAYVLVIILIGFIIMIHCFVFIYFQINKKTPKTIFFIIISKIFTVYTTLNGWIFILPLNDILLSVFETNDVGYNSLLISNNSNNTSIILMIFSLLNVGFNIYLGIFSLIFNRAVRFAEKRNIIIQFDSLKFLLFALRVLISTFSIFFADQKWLFFLMLFAYFLITLLQIYETFLFNDTELCRFLYGTIFFCLSILSIIAFWEYTTLFTQEHVSFILLTICPLGFKLGCKYFDYLYAKNVYRELTHHEKIVYVLQELYDFSQFNAGVFDNEKFFFFSGVFMSHLKRCNDEECVSLKKYFIDQENMKNNEIYATNKLILQKFKVEMEILAKNNEKFSKLIMSFISFLITANVNPVKSFLEIQKITNNSRNSNLSISVLDEICIRILKKKIKWKMKDLKKVKNIRNINKVQGLSVETFFKLSNKQALYDKELANLLKEKKTFWEYYQIGITTSSQLLNSIGKLSKKIQNFEKLVTPDQKTITNDRALHLIQLKYQVILHSTVLSSLNCAYKYEDEFEQLAKRETQYDENLIQNMSFLSLDFTLVQISFLNYHGVIREECKNRKVAELFGFSLLEFQTINSLALLMPEFFAVYHHRFIDKFFRKSMKELENSAETVCSFGLHKKGFVFPIRIFHGYNFDYKDDFVIIGALSKLAVETNFNMFLCQESGLFVGYSENLFKLFVEANENHNNVQPLLKFLNLCLIIPELKASLEEITSSKDKIMLKKSAKQHGNLIIPSNLVEILGIMKKIHDESESDELRTNNQTLNHSIRTIVSSRSTRIQYEGGINYQTIGKYFIYFRDIEKIRAEKFSDMEDFKKRLFRELISKGSAKKFSISFHLIWKAFQIGLDATQNIPSVEVHITKIKPKNIDNLEMQEIGRKEEEKSKIDNEIEDVSDLIHSDFRGLSNVLPPENPPVHFDQIFDKVLPKNFENSLNTSNILPSIVNEELIVSKGPISNENNEKMCNSNDKNEKSLKLEPFSNNDSSFQSNSIESFSSDSLNIGAPDNRISSKTSSINENRRNFSIFTAIAKIQNSLPPCLLRFFVMLMVEAALILVYFIILYMIYQDYITNKYEPSQKSLVNFSSLATGLSYSTAMFTEIEYQTFNIINRTLNSQKMGMWQRLMQENYINIKNINNQERNQVGDLQYQTLYKNIENLIIDYENFEIDSILFAENMDFYSDLVFTALHDFNSTPFNQLIIMQRNYPYVLTSTSTIYQAIKGEFLKSNNTTTMNVLYVLIGFLVAGALIKLFELLFLLKYHQVISQILRVFRRVNIQDAMNETYFCQEILQMIQGSSYLTKNYIEKRLNRKEILFEQERESNSASYYSKSSAKKKLDVKRKKTHKVSQYNMHGLPRTYIYVFMLFLLGICFAYYFFNYYFWYNNNNSILNLIQINGFFSDNYIYCTSMMGFNTLGLREKIIRNPEYEATNEIYQNHSVRMKYFYDRLVERLYIMGNNTANYLPQYTIQAQSSMNDQEFEQLIFNDICAILIKYQILLENEINFCLTSFNGAFSKGIIALTTEFLQNIKDFLPLIKVLSGAEEIEQQKTKVKETLNSENYENFMFSYFFFHNAMLIYYNKINDFYKGVLDSEMNNLYAFLFITSLFGSALFIVLAFYFKHKLNSYFKDFTICLSLIPYEKLINDEQTKFLIQNFLKRY